jgi:DNA-binding NtrC family response regulator/pSer/pThr/pTyr-binding forkhead associated (FHA) protein
VYYLHIKSLDGKERRAPIAPGVTTIGRSDGNTVVVDEFGVSARHAEIEMTGDGVSLRDLGSTNGTFINGRRIQSARLDPGDRILLGSVLLVLQEAVSDRIVIDERGSNSPSVVTADSDRLAPSVMENAYVVAHDEARPAASDSEDEAAAVLRLLEHLLDEHADGDRQDERFGRALEAMIRHLGAEAGFLLVRRGDGDWALRARSGRHQEAVISRNLLQRALETYTPICVEDPGGAAPASISLPLGAGDLSLGAIHLIFPPTGMAAARRKLGRLRTLLAAMALSFHAQETREALERTRRAVEAGGELTSPRDPEADTGDDLIGPSRAIRDVLVALARVAPASVSVLIQGESGTGKEQAARRIHSASNRRGAPFFSVHCAVPQDRLEAELFGVERRTETGGEPRRGKLELCDGGTLFMDEVAEVSAELQMKLLRVIEHGELQRMGGERSVPVDVRVLGATRNSIEDLAASGGLQEEVYFRLKPFEIRMPPLRERREDIIPLAQHFARGAAAEMHKRIVGLSMDACRALRDYSWPGNLRELRSVISRAVVLADDEIIDVNLLPLDITAGRLRLQPIQKLDAIADLTWQEAKGAFEKAYFQEVLQSSDGNISQAARRAGLARKNLYRKLKLHGITVR